jgi:hypothetical protein
VAVVFDVVDPFGRPRGFGPVSVLAAVDVSFFLGLPTRFFTGSGLEASFSHPSLPSLSAGDSGKAGAGVTFLPREAVVVLVADAVEALVAELAGVLPRGRTGFSSVSFIIMPSSSSVSSESMSTFAIMFFLAVVVLVTPLLFGSFTALAWELAVVLVTVDRGAVRVPRLAGDGGRTAARAMAASERAASLLLLLLLLSFVMLLLLS